METTMETNSPESRRGTVDNPVDQLRVVGSLRRSEMKIKPADIWVARVISDDGDRVLLEVPKSKDAAFTLDPAKENNQFLTFVFLHKDGTGQTVSWQPFDAEHQP